MSRKVLGSLCLALIANSIGSAATTAPPSTGVVVEKVVPGFDAAKAGIQPGDILLTWARPANPPANPASASGAFRSPFDVLEVYIDQAPRAKTLALGLQREGKTISTSICAVSVADRNPAGVLGEVASPLRRGPKRHRKGRPREGIRHLAGAGPGPRRREAGRRGRVALAARRDETVRGQTPRRRDRRNRPGARRSTSLFGRPEIEAQLWGHKVEVLRAANRHEPAQKAARQALSIRERVAPDSLAVSYDLHELSSVMQDEDPEYLVINQKVAGHPPEARSREPQRGGEPDQPLLLSPTPMGIPAPPSTSRCAPWRSTSALDPARPIGCPELHQPLLALHEPWRARRRRGFWSARARDLSRARAGRSGRSPAGSPQPRRRRAAAGRLRPLRAALRFRSVEFVRPDRTGRRRRRVERFRARCDRDGARKSREGGRAPPSGRGDPELGGGRSSTPAPTRVHAAPTSLTSERTWIGAEQLLRQAYDYYERTARDRPVRHGDPRRPWPSSRRARSRTPKPKNAFGARLPCGKGTALEARRRRSRRHNLGLLLWKTGRLTEAEVELRRAIDDLETQREQARRLRRVHVGLRRRFADYYKDYVGLLMELRREQDAFLILERFRAGPSYACWRNVTWPRPTDSREISSASAG